MRGRSSDYCFIEPMIINILKESGIPIRLLCINFKINEMSGKIINLNVVKSHLKNLVEKEKIVKNIDKDKIEFYSLNK